MFDEPEEPTDEEMAEGAVTDDVRKAGVRIEGLTVEHVLYAVRGIITSTYNLRQMLLEAIDKRLDQLVSERLVALTEERLGAAIDKAIAEGVVVYDSYSGKERGRTSIAEMVHKALAEKAGDGYRDKGTRAEIAVQKAVSALFEGELKGVVASVVADFKKQADAVFKARLVAGMKEAIGLR